MDLLTASWFFHLCSVLALCSMVSGMLWHSGYVSVRGFSDSSLDSLESNIKALLGTASTSLGWDLTSLINDVHGPTSRLSSAHTMSSALLLSSSMVHTVKYGLVFMTRIRKGMALRHLLVPCVGHTLGHSLVLTFIWHHCGIALGGAASGRE